MVVSDHLFCSDNIKKAAVSEMFSCLISSSDGKFPLMPFRIDHHRLLF